MVPKLLESGKFKILTRKKTRFFLTRSFYEILILRIYLDHGYENPYIISSDPPINAIVPLRITNIKINYKIPIEVSSKYLFIFDSSDKMRQKILSSDKEFLEIIEDGKT